ncbi:MAG: (2Fe-2S)-binding protein [Gemmatimonadota bacterium]
MEPGVRIEVDGVPHAVPAGATVAAALLNAGVSGFRRAVSGTLRAPLCGMGSCFECRVRIDGVPHRRACMEVVRDGMEVRTGA